MIAVASTDGTDDELMASRRVTSVWLRLYLDVWEEQRLFKDKVNVLLNLLCIFTVYILIELLSLLL